MNDRFKFEAYIPVQNKIIPVMALNANGSIIVSSIHLLGKEGDDVWLQDYEVELRQCTGVVDKNGKLIYEGDVLRWCWEPMDELDASEFYKETGSRFSRIYNVKFNGSGFNLPRDAVMNAEIIGNIYENPELLKSKP